MSLIGEPSQIAVFGSDPLLSVAIEAGGEGDEVHVDATGHGVWVARIAAELGASTVFCWHGRRRGWCGAALAA